MKIIVIFAKKLNDYEETVLFDGYSGRLDY